MHRYLIISSKGFIPIIRVSYGYPSCAYSAMRYSKIWLILRL